MKPTAELARSIAEAVMHQVERDNCLNSARLTEAILARMLVTEAYPPAKPEIDGELQRLVMELLEAINIESRLVTLSQRLIRAHWMMQHYLYQST